MNRYAKQEQQAQMLYSKHLNEVLMVNGFWM